LPAIVLRDSAQPGRIVDGQHHAEPETLKQEAGNERSHALPARGGCQRHARRRQDEEPGHEWDATAHPVEGATGQRPRQDDRDRGRNQSDPGGLGAHSHHKQEVEGHQEAEAEFDHAGEELAQIGGEEVEVAEQPKLEQRLLDS
jgi:hypothetical protein